MRSRTLRWGALALLLSADSLTMARDRRTELVTRMNPAAAVTFRKAWMMVHGGNSHAEIVVLIVNSPEGAYQAIVQTYTNQHHRFAFPFRPDVVAVFHSHPSCIAPEPSNSDRILADRIQVPIATMTRDGLFVYDPTTRTTELIMRRLDWLKTNHWGVGATRPALVRPAETAGFRDY